MDDLVLHDSESGLEGRVPILYPRSFVMTLQAGTELHRQLLVAASVLGYVNPNARETLSEIQIWIPGDDLPTVSQWQSSGSLYRGENTEPVTHYDTVSDPMLGDLVWCRQPGVNLNYGLGSIDDAALCCLEFQAHMSRLGVPYPYHPRSPLTYNNDVSSAKTKKARSIWISEYKQWRARNDYMSTWRPVNVKRYLSEAERRREPGQLVWFPKMAQQCLFNYWAFNDANFKAWRSRNQVENKAVFLKRETYMFKSNDADRIVATKLYRVEQRELRKLYAAYLWITSDRADLLQYVKEVYPFQTELNYEVNPEGISWVERCEDNQLPTRENSVELSDDDSSEDWDTTAQCLEHDTEERVKMERRDANGVRHTRWIQNFARESSHSNYVVPLTRERDLRLKAFDERLLQGTREKSGMRSNSVVHLDVHTLIIEPSDVDAKQRIGVVKWRHDINPVESVGGGGTTCDWDKDLEIRWKKARERDAEDAAEDTVYRRQNYAHTQLAERQRAAVQEFPDSSEDVVPLYSQSRQRVVTCTRRYLLLPEWQREADPEPVEEGQLNRQPSTDSFGLPVEEGQREVARGNARQRETVNCPQHVQQVGPLDEQILDQQTRQRAARHVALQREERFDGPHQPSTGSFGQSRQPEARTELTRQPRTESWRERAAFINERFARHKAKSMARTRAAVEAWREQQRQQRQPSTEKYPQPYDKFDDYTKIGEQWSDACSTPRSEDFTDPFNDPEPSRPRRSDVQAGEGSSSWAVSTHMRREWDDIQVDASVAQRFIDSRQRTGLDDLGVDASIAQRYIDQRQLGATGEAYWQVLNVDVGQYFRGSLAIGETSDAYHSGSRYVDMSLVPRGAYRDEAHHNNEQDPSEAGYTAMPRSVGPPAGFTQTYTDFTEEMWWRFVSSVAVFAAWYCLEFHGAWSYTRIHPEHLERVPASCISAARYYTIAKLARTEYERGDNRAVSARVVRAGEVVLLAKQAYSAEMQKRYRGWLSRCGISPGRNEDWSSYMVKIVHGGGAPGSLEAQKAAGMTRTLGVPVQIIGGQNNQMWAVYGTFWVDVVEMVVMQIWKQHDEGTRHMPSDVSAWVNWFGLVQLIRWMIRLGPTADNYMAYQAGNKKVGFWVPIDRNKSNLDGVPEHRRGTEITMQDLLDPATTRQLHERLDVTKIARSDAKVELCLKTQVGACGPHIRVCRPHGMSHGNVTHLDERPNITPWETIQGDLRAGTSFAVCPHYKKLDKLFIKELGEGKQPHSDQALRAMGLTREEYRRIGQEWGLIGLYHKTMWGNEQVRQREGVYGRQDGYEHPESGSQAQFQDTANLQNKPSGPGLCAVPMSYISGHSVTPTSQVMLMPDSIRWVACAGVRGALATLEPMRSPELDSARFGERFHPRNFMEHLYPGHNAKAIGYNTMGLPYAKKMNLARYLTRYNEAVLTVSRAVYWDFARSTMSSPLPGHAYSECLVTVAHQQWWLPTVVVKGRDGQPTGQLNGPFLLEPVFDVEEPFMVRLRPLYWDNSDILR